MTAANTDTAIDPREDKLPKWARDEMARLRRRTSDAERLAEQTRLDTDPEGSRTVLLRGIDDPIGLGEHATVRFRLSADNFNSCIDVRLSSDPEGAYVDVNCTSGGLAMSPRASNAAYLRVTPR